MFCIECGKENVEAVKFCVHCGADLRTATSRAALTGGAGGAKTPQPLGADNLDATVETMSGGGRELREGELLAGQFRIVGAKPLGAGGMGEVWRADDTELGTPVAIKVLPAMLARNEIAVANLKKEAMIGRQLTHPSICRLYSFHSDGTIKFIVMEFVNGKTIQQMLLDRDDQRMTWAELAPIARQIADALDYAHGVAYSDSGGRQVRGVLHRDIKPGNIMVANDGAAKLMDFGIAREMHDTVTEVTGRTSQTPLYASPEQFRGLPVTAASDIYSFAAVLFECLAGRRLVTAHGDLAWQILNRAFEPVGELSEAANAALAAGLAKDSQARPASARALVDQMDGKTQAVVGGGAAGAVSSAATQSPLQAARENAGAIATSAAVGASKSPPKKAIIVGAAAAAVVVAIVATVLLWPRHDEPVNVAQNASPSSSAGSTSSGGSTTGGDGSAVSAAASPGGPAATPAPASPASGAPAPPSAGGEKIISNSIRMKLVYIRPGQFTMGSPADEAGRSNDEQQRTQTIAKGFFLGATEVTQAQWRAVMGDNPSFFKGDDLPVEKVSWHRAVDFCDALGKKEGRTYRLPTEAEWEYACRAGTTATYSTGRELSTDQANFDGQYGAASQSAGANRGKTTPAGSLPPNAWGLYDMHGNVWEWCSDQMSVRAVGRTGKVSLMALRGGSWQSRASDCRPAYRYKLESTSAEKHIGFRVVLESSE